MSDLINCGSCGDPHRYDETHDCWVVRKIQVQETLTVTCPICGDPILQEHWRCIDAEQTTHPVIG
jgi:hypothetical protein